MKEFCSDNYISAVQSMETVQMKGKITKVIGLVIESDGPSINMGELCYIYPRTNAPPLPAEVVGFRENRVLLMPLGEMQGIGPGSEVVSSQRMLRIKVGRQLLGRILDALGNPIYGTGFYSSPNAECCLLGVRGSPLVAHRAEFAAGAWQHPPRFRL